MVELLDLILGKKELAGINKDFAKEKLDAYLEKNPSILEAYNKDPERFTKKKEFEKLRSELRKELRDIYGLFFNSNYSAKKNKYVDSVLKGEDKLNELLSLHKSTQERMEHYPFLYSQLFASLGEIKSILDLGCGFNPFSYSYLGCEPEYYSADIACDDLILIGHYLDRKAPKHQEFCLDLTKTDRFEAFPEVDVIFAFKLFDSLETLQRDITAQILPLLKAKFLIVSFPTASIGQKKSLPAREWFEKLVTGKVINRVTLPNEEFLIITLEK